jgi:hypothetical protein
MKTRLLLIGAILLLAIPLAYLLQDVTRQVFLVQILRITWTIRLLFESLPQTITWSILVAVALLIAVRSLMARPIPEQQPDRATEQLGQVSTLTKRVQRSWELEYSRRSLARDMRALALEVLAYQHRTTAQQIRQDLRTGRLEMPPEIQAYLNMERWPIRMRPTNFLLRLRRRLSPRARAPQMDPELERIVQFLESQLGIGPWLEDRPQVEAQSDR